MKNFYTIVLIQFLLITVSCSDHDRAVNSKLEVAFEKLYLSYLGKDYPPNPKILKICKQNKIEECLRAYNQVMEAGQYIKNQAQEKPDATLEAILKSVSSNCSLPVIKNEPVKEMQCYGAIISWYYFNGATQDNRIREFVSKSSIDINRAVFSHRFEWYYNRPNVASWIDIVNALPISALTNTDKQRVVNDFNDAKTSGVRFGIMLLE